MGYIPGKKNELMEIDRLYEYISYFSFNKNILNESTLDIKDISNLSKFPNLSLKEKKYFIIHHTAGRGNEEDIVNILNTRKNKNGKPIILGIQYIIDRDGNVYRGTKGSKGAHIGSFYPSAPKDMSNSTAEGVEIIGSDDTDILIPQCKATLRLIKSLNYPLSNVYGHGEVSSNKMKEEGSTCKAYVTKYWNTPVSELPDSDPELSKTVNNNTTKDKKPEEKKSEEKKSEDKKPEEKKSEDKSKPVTTDFCQCLRNEKKTTERFKFLDAGRKCDSSKSDDQILTLAKTCLESEEQKNKKTGMSILGWLLREEKFSKNTKRINQIIKKVL